MAELEFQIVGWLGASEDEPLERETAASLRITAGPTGIPLTEVEDTIAHTVRTHINVSAHTMARWLLVNWWRLRWEPQRENPSYDWLRSHSIGAIGGSYAWPPLTFSSDGEFVQLRLESESSPDMSAVRYLREVTIDIPAAHFEQAVEKFVDAVEARLVVRVPDERELIELRVELRAERGNAQAATECKFQALAGFDPGAAPQEWIRAARRLTERAGSRAVEEILAAMPELADGLTPPMPWYQRFVTRRRSWICNGRSTRSHRLQRASYRGRAARAWPASFDSEWLSRRDHLREMPSNSSSGRTCHSRDLPGPGEGNYWAVIGTELPMATPRSW